MTDSHCTGVSRVGKGKRGELVRGILFSLGGGRGGERVPQRSMFLFKEKHEATSIGKVQIFLNHPQNNFQSSL